MVGRRHRIGRDADRRRVSTTTEQYPAVKRAGIKLVQSGLAKIDAHLLLDTARCVRPWGEVVVVGLLGGPPILNNFNLMMDIPNTVKLSFFNSQMPGSDALPLRDAPLNAIANGIASGGVPSSLAKVFPVDDIRGAHRLLDGGTAGGKIVVTR